MDDELFMQKVTEDSRSLSQLGFPLEGAVVYRQGRRAEALEKLIDEVKDEVFFIRASGKKLQEFYTALKKLGEPEGTDPRTQRLKEEKTAVIAALTEHMRKCGVRRPEDEDAFPYNPETDPDDTESYLR
jgi:hypothetical protein